MQRFIVMVGPAGSGKTALTDALASVIEGYGAQVARVNFDPAAETLPYTPDVDVRNYVTVRSLMEEAGLGPNGALIAAVDMLINYAGQLREEVESFEADYVIIDTPGQMELFAFRIGGPIVLNAVIQDDPAATVFLIDPSMIEPVSNLVSAFTLASSVAVRLRLSQVNVFSKADMIIEEALEVLERVGEEGFLRSLVEGDDSLPGDLRALSAGLADALYTAGFIGEVLPVSALKPDTVAALYAKLQQILAGGDDFRFYDVKHE